jgi:AraC-like DNA-binding protein
MKQVDDHRVEIASSCLEGVDCIVISSARTFPRHAHDQFGLGIMRKGGHVSWSNCGRVEAERGNVIAVSPNEMHDGVPLGGHRVWEMVFVEPETIARLVGRSAAVRELGFAARPAPELKGYLEQALRALRYADAAAAEESLTSLFSTALLPPPPIEELGPSRETRLVLQRIHDLPASPPSLDEVAHLMGLHRTSALRRFRREVGATPHEYAMQIRLRLARRGLARGASPADVAIDLGFADQSHLTRAFARQFGLPPGRYSAANATILQDRRRWRGL